MSENTKNITINGLFWNAIDRFGNQGIVTIVGIVTARILSPEDFGIIGILLIFSTVATAFIDSGLATSLVRTRVVGERDYSSMFVFNLTASLFLYALLFFAAPLIEHHNGIEHLALYARVMFLQILIHAFGIVQYVKILKNFQFQITARINVIAIFITGIIVITLAYLEYGVWPLILQPVLYAFFRTVLLWLWGDWKMDFRIHYQTLKRHLSFSLSFIASNIMGKALSPFYYSFIGSHFSISNTGYYYQANKWGETPNLLISSIIQGTTLSTLTPIQDDRPRFLNACRKTMRTLAFVLFPASFLAIAIAEPSFSFFLTETWQSSVPYFQLLCFAGLFISLGDMNVNFLNIKGRSGLSLRLEIIKWAFALVLLAFTYKHGLFAVIYGQIGLRIACFLCAAIISQGVYGYGIVKQVKDIFPAFFISLFSAAIASIPQQFSLVSHELSLITTQSLIFVMVYIIFNQFIKNEIWLEIVELLSRKFSKSH